MARGNLPGNKVFTSPSVKPPLVAPSMVGDTEGCADAVAVGGPVEDAVGGAVKGPVDTVIG